MSSTPDGPVPGDGRVGLDVGLDIGGTGLHVVVRRADGAVCARAQAPTPAREGGAAVLSAATDLVEGVVRSTGGHLRALGVGAAGVVEQGSGLVLAASDSFVDWVGVAIADELSGRLGAPVVVDNDANAFLAGEASAGAVAGLRDVAGITLGTGVGGALLLGGALHLGAGGAAGEIGHTPGFGDEPCTCGQRGHLESLAGGRAVARRYAARTGRTLPPSAIAEAARGGDQAAAAVWEDAGQALGHAGVVLTTLLDVAAVVVGGGLAGAWDLLEPAAARRVAASPPVSGRRVDLRRSALGADAVAVGAASLAAGLAHGSDPQQPGPVVVRDGGVGGGAPAA